MTPATEGPDQGLGELTNLHQQLDGPGVKITVGQAPGNAVMLKPLIAGQSHRSEVDDRVGIHAESSPAIHAPAPVDASLVEPLRVRLIQESLRPAIARLLPEVTENGGSTTV